MARRPDDRQMTLEALIDDAPKPSQPVSRGEPGSLDISTRIRDALSDLLGELKVRSGGELDRYAVAAMVSRLSGRDITKHMLDRYCAPSAEDWRFPLEALPALVAATGDHRLLELVAAACGCRLLREDDAWMAEIVAHLALRHQVDERIRSFAERIPDDVLDRLRAETQRRGRRP